MDNREIMEKVRRWQSSPFVHPLTCGNDSNHALLEPKEVDGNVVLLCEDCGYVQKHIPEAVLNFDLERHENQIKQMIADARAKGPRPQEEQERMAKRSAENDDQEGLREIKVTRHEKGGSMLNYLRVLTPEEEFQRRREHFAKIRPGSLFDLGIRRVFIAVKKVDELSWEVIEFTDENRKYLIGGQPCTHSILHFNDMDCLNLRQS